MYEEKFSKMSLKRKTDDKSLQPHTVKTAHEIHMKKSSKSEFQM